MNPTDEYSEYIEIPDGTPDEMVAFYVDTINKAAQETRAGMSKRYGELMEVCLHSDFKLEFKGITFIVLTWRTAKFQSKEEFFKDELETGE